MNAPAGWYPDPGGQAGMFRYWNGTSWSAELSSTPFATSPQPGVAPQQPRNTRRWPWGWLIAAVALVVAIVLVILGANRVIPLPFSPDGAGDPTPDPCRSSRIVGTPAAPRNDGRVHGGALSYPELPRPWTPPLPEDKVPFAVNATNQSYFVEPNYSQNHSWVAAMTVGDLVAGDGFFAPKEGAERVAQCVVGLFYGDNKIERSDVSSMAITVDGHRAWQLTTHLTFDIPGLKTKGETAIIVIVDTGKVTAGLLYASIPDTTPHLMPVAAATIAQLRVDA